VLQTCGACGGGEAAAGGNATTEEARPARRPPSFGGGGRGHAAAVSSCGFSTGPPIVTLNPCMFLTGSDKCSLLCVCMILP